MTLTDTIVHLPKKCFDERSHLFYQRHGYGERP